MTNGVSTKQWGWALAGLLGVSSACGDDGSSGDEGAGTSTGDDPMTGTAMPSSSTTEGADETAGVEELPEGCDALVEPSDDDQTAVQEALIDVESGQVLCLAAGTYSFTRQLTLDADGVTVRGAGAEDTILDFAEQISGGNGLLITSDDVTVEDFQVTNTPGDGIRADNVDNIAFVGISVIWQAEASVDNGAYGLYPVQSNGVTVQNCLVQGARDAGIYVGQSTQILVEDSEAVGNVAGIEIENSTDAIVRNNHAYDNTAGLLVFNIPGLDIGDGKRANVYGNLFENNNIENFAEPGTIVAQVPPGLGVLILASDRNELADNEIRGNNSTGVLVLAYIDDLFAPPEDPRFDIFAEGNYIYNNTLSDNGSDPEALILAATGMADPVPDLLFDGCFDEAKDNSDGSLNNCLGDNGGATFMSLDLCMQGEMSTDPVPVTCEHEALPRDL